MRRGLAVLTLAFLYGTMTGVFGQRAIDHRAHDRVQSRASKTTKSAWSKLPQTEFSCVNKKLQEQGESIDSLIKRGILPSDFQVSELRTQCIISEARPKVDQPSARSKYVIDGIAVGSRLSTDSRSYREYSCSPSEELDKFTWCQKTRNEKKVRGSYRVSYSILNSPAGTVLYVSRYQEPAFSNASQLDKDLEKYSRSIGEKARIMKLPHREGLPDGIIALWGEITLEPLEQNVINALADGTSNKGEFLVDYIDDVVRSAKEGLPIYRIGGGPGLIWTTSFDAKGRGTRRSAAIDAAGLPSRSADQGSASQTPQQGAEASNEEVGNKPPELSQESGELPVQRTTRGNEVEIKLPVLEREIEKLRSDLVVATRTIAELEKAKSEAERAGKDAEKKKIEAEQTQISEKSRLDAMIAELLADKAAAARNRWSSLAYGGTAGLLVLVACLAAFVVKRQKDNLQKRPIFEPQPRTIANAHPQHSKVAPPTESSLADFDKVLRELERSLPRKGKAVF
jgi:hypothetical protein